MTEAGEEVDCGLGSFVVVGGDVGECVVLIVAVDEDERQFLCYLAEYVVRRVAG